ncbi:hypothetical protein [Mucilaginibacter myungsuensis]|uniref:Uncharacterized protein n=1 Tax=Mucilaginibacter myungsuensis TaxID=649104 RepID=A0A929KWB8_9SPHI|nr:hypothetical protein [Mucilaginibacter myungsuensis]MBE9662367.1 hypothetical protein [Mucilaginibacter myungsuensis]MDN3599196.1 hypothetical protein [Mucilaginibacter myungsuensis]
MRQIVGFIYLITLFSPPIFQLIYSRKRIKGLSKLFIGTIAGIAFLMSLVIPIGGMFLLLSLRPIDPDGLNCATGEVGGAIGFTLLNVMLTCVIGLISWWRYASKNADEELRGNAV